ncbi:MAG: putative selenate reductase subunit YgfK [Ignavibacteriales bacterium]|nr:MAG: putative selenate reductase subunit YgfK [Ignavibacteriales bacterium]
MLTGAVKSNIIFTGTLFPKAYKSGMEFTKKQKQFNNKILYLAVNIEFFMARHLQPIGFDNLLKWILYGFKKRRAIFNIPYTNFFFKKEFVTSQIFGESIETPVGPAAGPHTQLTQNIVAAYLTGSRFFELKTVQILDKLEIDKPCIDARDEGYNVEWSQELTLKQSYDEYVKTWFLLHFLNRIFRFSPLEDKQFVFNMSVGYDLKGIKSEPMDNFINQLKDASNNSLFEQYKNHIIEILKNGVLPKLLSDDFGLDYILDDLTECSIECIETISPNISSSVTLSTMHGCPSNEIEDIAKYLIKEKGLHTYIKLNPTLLGYDTVKEILNSTGFNNIIFSEHSFEKDLKFSEAVPMIKRLQNFAAENGKEFGVKLSNTFGVINNKKTLPGNEMYMSGRALFPLTINLANKLAQEFNGDLRISFSGGATIHNVHQLLKCGIYPVTFVTDLLKPGGYTRIFQIAEELESNLDELDLSLKKIDLEKLSSLAENSLIDIHYKKEKRSVKSIKIDKKLPSFDCYIAPCTVACPIHQNIPEYIRLVEEGKYAEAFEVIVAKNPLPNITGYICDHQCQNKCTRWDYDDPVQIREMKKVAAEKGIKEYLQNIESRIQKSEVKAAVVGAGPSGLAAGYFLAKAGMDVTIFDKNEKAGGTVQNVIPDFRLPQESIDADIDFIKRYGVKFNFGYKEEFIIDKLKAEDYKYIYLAIGAGNSRELSLNGNTEKVFNAIEFLEQYHQNEKINPGKKVAVIGGGNSAMDGARAALRCKGVEKVYIVYRRTKEFMPADKEELEAALEDGVIFKELLLPVEFSSGKLKCQKMKLGELDSDLRRKVILVEGEFEELEIDSVISAIGEIVDIEYLKKNKIEVDKRGSIIVNPETNETSIENVFVGGDALRGPATVIEGIADGKKAAETILKKEFSIQPEQPDFSYKFKDINRTVDILHKKGIISSANKVNHLEEAHRCLDCGYLCNKCVEVCPNRANITIIVNKPTPLERFTPHQEEKEFKDSYQILHVDGMCNECGNCETFCPYNGAPYKDKTTLFWSPEEFETSTNNGFLLDTKSSSDKDFIFKVRFNSSVGKIAFDHYGKTYFTGLSEYLNDETFKKFVSLIRITFTENLFTLIK